MSYERMNLNRVAEELTDMLCDESATPEFRTRLGELLEEFVQAKIDLHEFEARSRELDRY